MLYRFNFYEDKALLKVYIFGKADRQAIKARFDRLFNDRRWKGGTKLLIDYSGVTVIDTPKGFCETLEDLLKEVPVHRFPVGIAYNFPRRHFDQCFDPGLSTVTVDRGCRIGFFKEEKEALEWLEQLAAEHPASQKASA
ncbi:MAG: hypothetical protein ACOWWM_19815 [Desulfobacterales bacterium]|jgi:hypothetical protein